MTPRQLDRAVNAALGRILPPMVRALRDDLVAALREGLVTGACLGHDAAREAAPDGSMALPVASPCFAPVKADAEQTEALPVEDVAEAPDPAWFTGSGTGRRLTKEGLVQLRAMMDKRCTVKSIAKRLGMTASSAHRQMKIHAGALKAGSVPAEDGASPRMAEPALAEAQTVVVVPAGVVPAPNVPPAPVIIPATAAEPPDRLKAAPPPLSRAQAGGLATARLPRDPHSGRTIATPAAPMDPAQLEPVPASYEDALDRLFAELLRQKMRPAEIETRLAAMTTKQLLATCNAQRVKAGLSPYVLTERAA